MVGWPQKPFTEQLLGGDDRLREIVLQNSSNFEGNLSAYCALKRQPILQTQAVLENVFHECFSWLRRSTSLLSHLTGNSHDDKE